MDFEFLGPMIAWIVGSITVGAIVFFSPIARRICDLLEVITREKALLVERGRSEEFFETINERLSFLEERQALTEDLVNAGEISSRHNRQPGEA